MSICWAQSARKQDAAITEVALRWDYLYIYRAESAKCCSILYLVPRLREKLWSMDFFKLSIAINFSSFSAAQMLQGKAPGCLLPALASAGPMSREAMIAATKPSTSLSA